MQKVLLVVALAVVCACATPSIPGGLAGWSSSPPTQSRGFIYSSHELLPYSYLNTVPLTYGYSLRPQFTFRPTFTITAFAPASQPAYFTLPSASPFYPASVSASAPLPLKPVPVTPKPQAPIYPPFPENTPNFPSGKPIFPGGVPSFPEGSPSLPEGVPSIPGNSPSFPGISPSYPEGIPNFPDGIPTYPSNSPTFTGDSQPNLPGTPGKLPGFAPPSSFPSVDGGDKGLNDEDTVSVESA